jgi:type VI secretion system protein ImpH
MARKNRPQSGVVASETKTPEIEQTDAKTSDSNVSKIAVLEQLLQQQPYKFGFYQVLRRFECLYPRDPKIGTSLRPVNDVLRLAQEPTMAFSAATLNSFKIASKGPHKERPRSKLKVNFFGLFGPNGPLPLHLTEYARDRLRNADDPTFSEFLDIFHHRMLSLFYRSWASAQPTVNFDRPQEDRFSTYTGALFGLGMPSLRDRDEIPDRVKLHFAGRLSPQNRNVEGLVVMIRSFFNIPVEIEQFIGEWIQIPDNCRCFLGESPETGTLGESIVIGAQVWECQQKFRLILGPLNVDEYERFLPGRESGKRLRAMVRNYVGDSMNWDVNLVLKKEKVMPIKLGENDLLGWNTWLGDRVSDNDANDLTLEPMSAMI